MQLMLVGLYSNNACVQVLEAIQRLIDDQDYDEWYDDEWWWL